MALDAGRQAIADKFDQLTDDYANLPEFTHAERAIWYVVSIRCEIDMEGFGSLYEQAFQRAELVESVNYFRDVELDEIASAFEEVIALLDGINFWHESGWAGVDWGNFPSEFQNKLDAIGNKVKAGRKLWKVDDKLLEMLNREKGVSD
jgi:hypothetical protein